MEDTIEDLYCRLCADLKPSNALSNMLFNLEKRQEITDKLARFDIVVDFNNMLPKTVCLECIESLERAYDFITTVDVAQEAFKDYDPSALGNKTLEIVSDHETMDTTENECSIELKTESIEKNVPANESNKIFIPVNKEVEVECARLNEDKEKSSNLETIKELPLPKQRRKPKISKNVDLDTWPDYNWLCAFCGKFYHNPSELRVHAMQFHGTCNPYRCFDCKARGLHMDIFVTHISRHRPVLAKSCYRCSLKLENQKELKAHRATHFNTAYSCTGCNLCFVTKEELNEHISKFYKTAVSIPLVVQENDSLQCVICEKKLGSKLVLNRHLRLHTDRKRNFICDACGGSFYSRKALINHQIVHSDARPYKCEVCRYSFKMKHELRSHALRHFGTKPFTCEECGKTFRLAKELSIHSAVHKEVRPYKCTQCTKSFRFKHLLVQHQRMHTGSKPYACGNCPLRFRNWSNFNKHTKDAHGIDNSKRKRTSEGLYALDPQTKEVIYPDKEKVAEWKKRILADVKKGGKKKKAQDSSTDVTTAKEVDT